MVLEEFRKSRPELQKVPMTYAGRLDPLAEGVLLVLAGEEAKNREPYLKLSKSYTATVLLGIETDTLDVLGKVIKTGLGEFNVESLKQLVQKLPGEHMLPVPQYSSVPVQGKPMFEWARSGQYVEPPVKPMVVHKAELLETRSWDATELYEYIQQSVNIVSGDFRQEEILKTWTQFFEANKSSFQSFELEIECASGTYIRSLAKFLGNKLGTCASLLKLVRTRVGSYTLDDAVKI